ncbi:hypothetical protein O4160_12425 [Rhodococcus sp. IEGM 1401]|uniref:hypothetical protein n=1 Tax=unclassified Rhodococcus (in: high G+C Gram-positive bacteria) TaxID=192944 RepID=UPI0022B4F28A|nr:MULTISPECIES: hypothetical protein [unclassified Rhodococcus (in: high G+C Gram-positive bacteria)]MCZ4561641.1 hypothetical protein [Rhodococcus sp. IEGM 1401]MDI9921739.1 hypothetical protein [Rhodococcus sp. IEGM 1372]MDV8034236.1 hypothetical protein [Rhodococcus sp. IEGM 1414]
MTTCETNPSSIAPRSTNETTSDVHLLVEHANREVEAVRRDKSYLRLVGSSTPQPTIEVLGGPKAITVHVDNVLPGQMCEVLHNGMLSLSQRVIVDENATSITTFNLKPGEYNVSLRLDGRLDCVTESHTVAVGEELEVRRSS